MPKFSLPQFKSPNIRTVLLDTDAIVRPVYLSKRKGASLSVAATEFQHFVRKWVAAETAMRLTAGMPAIASGR